MGEHPKLAELNALLDAGPQEDDRRCTRCPLWETSVATRATAKTVRRSLIRSNGPREARILLVGEYPGESEVREDRTFTGKAGELLRAACEEAGVRKHVRATNVVRCRPPLGRLPDRPIWQPCLTYLEQEIDAVQPAVIGCLGLTALQEVTATLGSKKRTWSIHEELGRHFMLSRGRRRIHIVPVYNPAAYLWANDQDPFNRLWAASLTNALRLMGRLARIPTHSPIPEYPVATRLSEALEIINACGSVNRFAYDLETSPPDTSLRLGRPRAWRDVMLCIGLAWGPGRAGVIPWRNQIQEPGEPLQFYWRPEEMAVIRERLQWLFDLQATQAAGHNAICFDRVVLREDPSLRVVVRNQGGDTMVSDSLLDPRSKHGLKSMAFRQTPYGDYDWELEMARRDLPPNSSYALLPAPLLYRYCGCDADVDLQIDLNHLSRIRAFDRMNPPPTGTPSFEDFYCASELPVTSLAAAMMQGGILVDRERVNGLIEQYGRELRDFNAGVAALPEIQEAMQIVAKKLAAKAAKKRDDRTLCMPFMDEQTLTSPVFDMDKSEHMPAIIFDVLKLPVVKWTKRGNKPSTDKGALEIYERDHKIELCGKLRTGRQIQAYRRYLETQVLRHVDPDGILHTDYLVTGTKTGRWSSARPNLMNIPARGPRAKEIAGIFVARPGYVLCKEDHAQFEVRLLAYYTRDPVLIEDLRNDLDMHSYAAAFGFDVPLEEVLAQKKLKKGPYVELRNKAKTGIFETIYGGGPETLSWHLKISLEQAIKIQTWFWTRYAVAFQGQQDTIKWAREHGWTRSADGRIHVFPGIQEAWGSELGKLEREAGNFRIQELAHQENVTRGVNVVRRFKQQRIDGRIALQIHDCLVSEFRLDQWREALGILDVTRGFCAARLDVPLPIDRDMGFDLGRGLMDQEEFEKGWLA